MKTDELIGAPLDWAVARCGEELMQSDFYIHESSGAIMLERGEASWVYSPSTNWAQGGPIIERERLCVYDDGYGWSADCDGSQRQAGPTPLIAAMRCYVESTLGDDVEMPAELAQEKTI